MNMAMASSKNEFRKYCSDTFKSHKTKQRNDLGDVSNDLLANHPSKVQNDDRLCTSCKKRLCALSPEHPVALVGK